MIRHIGVDFAGELDKTSAKIPFLSLPRKVKRIHGNAMSAQPGAGIKRMKAKWLGGSGVDYFPDIDAHSQTQQLEFIYERDVYAAVDVLQKFGHLGDSW